MNPRPATPPARSDRSPGLELEGESPLAGGASRTQLPTNELVSSRSRTPRLPNTRRPRRVRRHRRCQPATRPVRHRRRRFGISRPIVLPAFAHLGPSRDSTRFRSLRQRHAMLWEASRPVTAGTREVGGAGSCVWSLPRPPGPRWGRGPPENHGDVASGRFGLWSRRSVEHGRSLMRAIRGPDRF